MRCKTCMELLSNYMDNQVNKQQKNEIEKHLNGCASCKEQYEVLKRIRSSMLELKEFTPPSQFHIDVLKKIQSEKNIEYRRKTKLNKRYLRIAETAVASFIFVIGIFIVQNSYYKKDLATPENVSFSSYEKDSGFDSSIPKLDQSQENFPLLEKSIDRTETLTDINKDDQKINNSSKIEKKEKKKESEKNIKIQKEITKSEKGSISKKESISEKAGSQNNDRDISSEEVQSLGIVQEENPIEANDNEVKKSNDITGYTEPEREADSILNGSQSNQVEKWEIGADRKQDIYTQIKELLLSENILFNAEEDNLVIYVYEIDKESLYKKIQELNNSINISRIVGQGNPVIIMIK